MQALAAREMGAQTGHQRQHSIALVFVRLRRLAMYSEWRILFAVALPPPAPFHEPFFRLGRQALALCLAHRLDQLLCLYRARVVGLGSLRER